MKKIGTLDYCESELRNMIIKDLEDRTSYEDLLNKYEDYAIYKSANDVHYILKEMNEGWFGAILYHLKDGKARMHVEYYFSKTKAERNHSPVEMKVDIDTLDRSKFKRIRPEEFEQWITDTSQIRIIEVSYFNLYPTQY